MPLGYIPPLTPPLSDEKPFQMAVSGYPDAFCSRAARWVRSALVYSPTETKGILVLGICKCNVRRPRRAAHIRLRSVHGRGNGVPNQRFRRFRTPPYCTMRVRLLFYIALMKRVQKVANALNGIAMAVDITITISLCTLLVMGRTGFAEYVPCQPFHVSTSSNVFVI